MLASLLGNSELFVPWSLSELSVLFANLDQPLLKKKQQTRRQQKEYKISYILSIVLKEHSTHFPEV